MRFLRKQSVLRTVMRFLNEENSEKIVIESIRSNFMLFGYDCSDMTDEKMKEGMKKVAKTMGGSGFITEKTVKALRVIRDYTIIGWFDYNYIEEKETIYKILEEASIKHDCNFQSLFESCQIMKQTYPKKTSLRREVQYFAKLADHGIKGYDAGKKLSAYFDVGR